MHINETCYKTGRVSTRDFTSIIILTKLTALAVHYAITILLPRPRNKRELQVYYGLVVCTHRVAQWFKSFSKEAFLFSWSCTIHIIFAPSLQSLLLMRQLTTRIGILFVPKVHILILTELPDQGCRKVWKSGIGGRGVRSTGWRECVPPGWDRVNWSAKIWRAAAPLPPTLLHACRCGRVVTDFDWEAKNRFNF